MMQGSQAADEGFPQVTGASRNEDSHAENFLTRTANEKDKTKALGREGLERITQPATTSTARRSTRPALRTTTSTTSRSGTRKRSSCNHAARCTTERFTVRSASESLGLRACRRNNFRLQSPNGSR
jgi:hypothetical protein